MPLRRRKTEEEIQAERLAFIGTLATGLAHEVRAPLNSILLNIGLIEERLDALRDTERPLLAKPVVRIKREIESLQNTVEQFLKFARPPRMDLLPTDLNRFLREMVDFVRPECDAAHIEIRTRFGPTRYPVLLDRGQFSHVILNLVHNARDAIRDGGIVTFETEETDREVTIRIADTGGGVDPAIEDRIFDVFFTTKENGTGLGLGIVRRIVEEHEGTVELENHPGTGATFVIRLPHQKILEYKGDNRPSLKSET